MSFLNLISIPTRVRSIWIKLLHTIPTPFLTLKFFVPSLLLCFLSLGEGYTNI